MKIHLLHEPELQFGTGTHIDIRFGLMHHGPLDVQSTLAPKQIRVGIVGDNHSIEGLRDWLIRCRTDIPAKPSNQPNLFPQFPGFGGDRACRSELLFNPALEHALPSEWQRLCGIANSSVLIVEAVNLFVSEIQLLAEKSMADVIVVAVPQALLEAIDPAAVDVDADDIDGAAPSVGPSLRLDFRHLLKAKTMNLGPPIQIVLPSTYDPSKRMQQRRRSDRLRVLQDEATRAWNLHVAMYYKAGGTPWQLIREPTELETCYVGVSFYHTLDKRSVSTSIAQVFNQRGLGVVVRGGNAAISKDDRQAHLDEDTAFALMDQALERYRQEHRHLPARIVIHKTSAYSDPELNGFTKAVQHRGVDSCDLLNVQDSYKRLFRDGKYPPLRGTFVNLDERNHLLYARGSVEFFATYPGLYVPKTVSIQCSRTSQTPRFLAQEILALTKMNWNNTQFDGGMPITIRASRQVAKILRYVGDGEIVQPRYSFYM